MPREFENYKRFFRDAHVEAEENLLGIHAVIYLAVNSLWIMLNMLFVPSKYRWIMFYPAIGWGAVLFAHWWFYVKNADRICRLKEERIEKQVASGAAR
ncbi:MAG: 2TM domain-containing protein [Methanotrichaceae archaeon]